MSLLACMTLAAAARAEPVKLLPGPFELVPNFGTSGYDRLRHLPLEPAAAGGPGASTRPPGSQPRGFSFR